MQCDQRDKGGVKEKVSPRSALNFNSLHSQTIPPLQFGCRMSTEEVVNRVNRLLGASETFRDAGELSGTNRGDIRFREYLRHQGCQSKGALQEWATEDDDAQVGVAPKQLLDGKLEPRIRR